MWKSIKNPPSTNRDVIVSCGDGEHIIAFYDPSKKTWHLSWYSGDDILSNFDEQVLHVNDIKLWCEIPKLTE